MLGLGLLLTLPLEQRTEGPRPVIAQETSAVLTQGVVLRQMVRLEAPVQGQIAFRIWGRVEPNTAPRLVVRCLTDNQQQAPVEIQPPIADGGYYALEIPWCDAAEARNAGFMLEGEGIRLLASVADRFPGTFSVNNSVQPAGGLVLQVLQRTPGIDRYVPVSRWAASKPGIIGWPRLYILLPYLYIVITGTLFHLIARDRKWLFS